MVAEMEAHEATDAAIEAFLDASLDDDKDADAAPELWPENAEAFRVFTLCKWDREIISGMEETRVIYTGISAAEIHHTCQLLNVSPDRTADVLACVRTAIDAALPLLNDQG